MRIDCDPITMRADGLVIRGPVWLDGYLMGVDGINDATVEVYNNADEASGYEPIPTIIYGGTKKGAQGFFARRSILCAKGIWVKTTCAGSYEITFYIS